MARRYIPKNRNAFIVSRETLNGKFRTETTNRDEGSIGVALSTDPTTSATKLFINGPVSSVRLNGHEARTLYRAMQKHFQYVGKSW